jgi:hypothetical protein
VVRCLHQQQRTEAARELATSTLAVLREHYPEHRITKEAEKLLASLPQ